MIYIIIILHRSMFFPYNDKLVRCHPIGFSFDDDATVIQMLRCGNSFKKYKWKCSECDVRYYARTGSVLNIAIRIQYWLLHSAICLDDAKLMQSPLSVDIGRDILVRTFHCSFQGPFVRRCFTVYHTPIFSPWSLKLWLNHLEQQQ